MDERKLVRNDPFYGITAMPGDHFLSFDPETLLELVFDCRESGRA
jgi:hypothetical protein